MRKRIKSALPSPAMALAFVALLVALGGTATALDGKNKVDNNDLKKNTVDSANIVKNQVKAEDVDEASLNEVPLRGEWGAWLCPDQPERRGADVASVALNIASANVTNPADGVYCINGLTFTPKTVLITGDAENTQRTGQLLHRVGQHQQRGVCWCGAGLDREPGRRSRSGRGPAGRPVLHRHVLSPLQRIACGDRGLRPPVSFRSAAGARGRGLEVQDDDPHRRMITVVGRARKSPARPRRPRTPLRRTRAPRS